MIGSSTSVFSSSCWPSSKRAAHSSLSWCTATFFWCRMLIVGVILGRYYTNSFHLAKKLSTSAARRNLQRPTNHHHHYHQRPLFWTLQQSISNKKFSFITTRLSLSLKAATTTSTSASASSTSPTSSSDNNLLTATINSTMTAATTQSDVTTNGDDSHASSSSCTSQEQQESFPRAKPRAKRISLFQNNINKDDNIINSSILLEACGERIRNGDLVAFPTETVYGLGCNALNAEACQKVFMAKERPFTDPLIAHVNYPHEAYALWHATSSSSTSSYLHNDNKNNNQQEDDDSNNPLQLQQQQQLQHECLLLEKRILETLCLEFWPGPLTLVARAAVASSSTDSNNNSNDTAAVMPPPSILMAGTGFVACRSPTHPIARRLIQAARVPIAAPSANKFGHVSPTTAKHVWDDLQNENVWIVEDDYYYENNNVNSTSGGGVDEESSSSSLLIQKQQQLIRKMDKQNSCDIGVESTVAKLEVKVTTPSSSSSPSSSSAAHLTATLRVLRQGAIAAQELESCLQKALAKGVLSRHDIGDHHGADDNDDSSSPFPSIQLRVLSQHKNTTVNDTVATVAPGQTIRHYSPRIPSFVLSHECIQRESSSSSVPESNKNSLLLLQQAVVVDFGQTMVQWKNVALAYRDLSDVGDSAQAARCVFETLRWAEQVVNAKRIFFPSLSTKTTTMKIHEIHMEDKQQDDALLLAVEDRLTRAASGVILERLEDVNR